MSRNFAILVLALALFSLSLSGEGADEGDDLFQGVKKWEIVMTHHGGSGGERRLYTRTFVLSSTGDLKISAKDRDLFDAKIPADEVKKACEAAQHCVRGFRLGETHRSAEDGSDISLRIVSGNRSIEVEWDDLMNLKELNKDCRKLFEIIENRLANETKIIRSE